MKRTLFSITIPAYKGKFLSEAIGSCLGQLYQDFELIVVDDASPENLQAIVSNFGDARIRYYRNEVNHGAVNVVDNWNKCLEYCKGDYVICMGDDDKLKPNCLLELVKLMNDYPNLDAYHLQTEIIDEDSIVTEIQAPRPIFESAYSLLCNRWLNRNRQFLGDFCFRVKRLRELGGYYKLPLGWASDDITAVMMAEITGIANTQTPCFQYRENRYSITKSSNANFKLEALIQEKKWYNDFLKKKPFNETDKIYRDMALRKSEGFFKWKQDQYLWQVAIGSHQDILLCISNRHSYEISNDRIVRFILRAIKQKLKSLFL